jgi:hypothetical protein
MEKVQKVIVALLIVAIVFSLITVALSLSVGNVFKMNKPEIKQNDDSNVGIIINPPAGLVVSEEVMQ